MSDIARRVIDNKIIDLKIERTEVINNLPTWGYVCRSCNAPMGLKKGADNTPHFFANKRIKPHDENCTYKSDYYGTDGTTIREASESSQANKIIRNLMRDTGLDLRSDNEGGRGGQGPQIEEKDDDARDGQRGKRIYQNEVITLDETFPDSYSPLSGIYFYENKAFLNTEYKGYEYIQLNTFGKKIPNIRFTKHSLYERLNLISEIALKDGDVVEVKAALVESKRDLNGTNRIKFSISKSRVVIINPRNNKWVDLTKMKKSL